VDSEADETKARVQLAQARAAAALRPSEWPSLLEPVKHDPPDVWGIDASGRHIGIEVTSAIDQASKRVGADAGRFVRALRDAVEERGLCAIGSLAIGPAFRVTRKSCTRGLPLLVDRIEAALRVDEPLPRRIPGTEIGAMLETAGVVGLLLWELPKEKPKRPTAVFALGRVGRTYPGGGLIDSAIAAKTARLRAWKDIALEERWLLVVTNEGFSSPNYAEEVEDRPPYKTSFDKVWVLDVRNSRLIRADTWAGRR
jgi:hypothetical protein